MTMKNKMYTLLGWMLGSCLLASGQDLITHVPADADVVVALNGEGFFKHTDRDHLNAILDHLNWFEEISGETAFDSTHDVANFGIDIERDAYLYISVNDSIQYFGGVFPMADRNQLESVLSATRTINRSGDWAKLDLSDKTTQVTWNDQVLYLLVAAPMDAFFEREDIKARYGFLENPDYSWNYWDDSSYYGEESYAYAEEEIDTSAWAIDPIDSVASNEIFEETEEELEYSVDEFAYVDSVLARDEYQDDYYMQAAAVRHHNDSLVRELTADLLESRMHKIKDQDMPSYRSKRMTRLKSNELVHVEIVNIDSLISHYLPYDMLYAGFGIRPRFNYGYEAMESTILVDGNTMKMTGSIGLSKDVVKYYRDIYRNKLDRKFYSLVSDDALGFLSINFNTEAYLSHTPELIRNMYQYLSPREAGILDLVMTMFNVVVDEKAVAKVFPGDNLLVINGVTQQEVTYTDYEYDEDYNYQEIEKTKTETVPQYLWAFSSENSTLFQQILAILEQENEVLNLDGIYEVQTRKSSGLTPYVTMGNGMVFLSNDFAYLQELKANNFQGQGGKRYRPVLRKNRMTALVNTQRVRGLVDELNFPLTASLEKQLEEMGEYGDVYFLNDGVKRNKLSWEFGVDFPQERENALEFIFHTIEEAIISSLD